MRKLLFNSAAALSVISLRAEEHLISALVSSEVAFNEVQRKPVAAASGIFQAKDYSHLFGMDGFSDDALNMHFKLYQGYVTNTNAILSLIDQLESEGKQQSIYYAELKRRLMWEYDGMRMHEGYFENLGGEGSSLDTKDPLYRKIRQDFGSFENWHTDFVATGLMRGVGWVVLYLDPRNGKLVNAWIAEHDKGHLEGGTPLLIMDVWEHAFIPDYGLDRSKYIQAFFKNVDWDVVSTRFYKEVMARKAAAEIENAQTY